MNQRWNILLKGLAAIGAVLVICISIARLTGIGSETLGDIAREHPQPTATPRVTAEPRPSAMPDGLAGDSQTPEELASPLPYEFMEGPGHIPAGVPEPGDNAYNTESSNAAGADNNMMIDNLQNLTGSDDTPLPVGLSLNGDLMADARITWENGFYYEPLSPGLAEYITGASYPANLENPAITVGELTYVHVLYQNFDGNPAEGELICNQSIAQDLVEIFYELYKAEYQIEKIQLIDVYGGDDDLSMADNNTSCFNYRVVSGSSSLSRHAYGLAIDINPLYNPYITYNKDQTINVSPIAGEDYADRSKTFPYKIDEDDLCCRLFKEHGFTWGGNWNSCKDYQHFQKTP